jgi:peptidoglycan/LPS O-acetylase OafA/YrhL
MQYRREVDGLRAIAVLPVILFHAGFNVFSGGYIGVDVFFVISGYLITTILINELEDERFSIARFYERRARRILPALFVVMLACLPFAYMWMLPSQLKDFAQSLVAVVFFGSNILFWRESGYFAADAELMPLLHTWSLAVEEQYYIVFPIFLLLAWRFGRNKVFWSVVVIAAISLLLSEWGWRNKPSANFYLAPTRAWELFAGSICAFLTVGRTLKSNNVLSAIGLAAIVVSIFAFDDNTPFPSVYALVPVVGTALIILFGRQGTWVAKLLSIRAFVGVGLISYSAYLWHQPLFAFARLRSLTEPSHILMAGLAVAALLLAWVTWRWVEQPFRKRANPVLATQRSVFAASGAVGAVFVALGLAGHVGNGFEWRHPDIVDRVQVINDLKQDRQQAIGAGICHFNQRGLHQELSEFLRQWNCIAGYDNSEVHFAVYGDSHAADKAVALRLIGLEIAQLGGASCPLYPSTVPVYCDVLLSRFLSNYSRSDNVIILANRFSMQEVESPYLEVLLDFWGSVEGSVILFSPMPEYKAFDNTFLRSGQKTASNIIPNRAIVKGFWENLEDMDIPQNITVVDTEKVFCDISEIACSPIYQDNFLLVDSSHLSTLGALEFGLTLRKNLLEIGWDRFDEMGL